MIRFVAARNSGVSTTLTGAGLEMARTTPLDDAGQGILAAQSGPKNSSNRSPNQASKMSISAYVTGTRRPGVDHPPGFHVVFRA
jgi:hypothetical protein